MTHPLSSLRLLVAEACGWLNLHPSGRLDGQIVGTNPKLPIIGKCEEPPDYSTSLDACAEFESRLNTEDRNAYAVALERIVMFGANPHWSREYHLATATPKQRCRAFLTMKKIQDEFTDLPCAEKVREATRKLRLANSRLDSPVNPG